MALRQRQSLHILRRLHERRNKPTLRMPLDVTMEEPHARIVGPEPDYRVAPILYHERVAPHGRRGDIRGESAVVVPAARGGAR